MADRDGPMNVTRFLVVAMLLSGCAATVNLTCPSGMIQTMRGVAQDQANYLRMPVGMGYAGPDNKTGKNCSMGYVAYPKGLHTQGAMPGVASANGLALSQDRCQVPASQRRDCGNGHIQQDECEAKGCCWKPDKGNLGLPWCFHSDSGSNSTHEMFLFGSYTKVWTASAFLKLKNEGKISLDEPAFKYMEVAYQNATGESLVKLFGSGIKNVTIKQLLAMRASILDYDEFGYQIAHPLEDLGPARTVQLFGKGTMINLPPGSCGMYSSMSYVLLGLVLLGQSNRTFDTYDQNVWRERFPGITFGVHGTCSNYTKLNGSCYACRSRRVEVNDMSCTSGYTCGNLIGSPEDVARFTLAVFSGELLGPETTKEMVTGKPFGSPGASGINPSDCQVSFNYGHSYGLGVELHFDPRFPGHEGVTYGFTSQSKYDEVSKAAYVAAIPTSNPGDDAWVNTAWDKLWKGLTGNQQEAIVV